MVQTFALLSLFVMFLHAMEDNQLDLWSSENREDMTQLATQNRLLDLEIRVQDSGRKDLREKLDDIKDYIKHGETKVTHNFLR